MLLSERCDERGPFEYLFLCKFIISQVVVAMSTATAAIVSKFVIPAMRSQDKASIALYSLVELTYSA